MSTVLVVLSIDGHIPTLDSALSRLVCVRFSLFLQCSVALAITVIEATNHRTALSITIRQ